MTPPVVKCFFSTFFDNAAASYYPSKTSGNFQSPGVKPWGGFCAG
jgi:hypothetical protein